MKKKKIGICSILGLIRIHHTGSGSESGSASKWYGSETLVEWLKPCCSSFLEILTEKQSKFNVSFFQASKGGNSQCFYSLPEFTVRNFKYLFIHFLHDPSLCVSLITDTGITLPPDEIILYNLKKKKKKILLICGWSIVFLNNCKLVIYHEIIIKIRFLIF